MPRIATRMFGPAQLTNSAATKITVPSSHKYIIRHMHFSNPSAATVSITVSIGADAAGTRIFDSFPIGAGQTYDHFGIYVLDAAEILQAFASTTSVIVMTVDGDDSVLG